MAYTTTTQSGHAISRLTGDFDLVTMFIQETRGDFYVSYSYYSNVPHFVIDLSQNYVLVLPMEEYWRYEKFKSRKLIRAMLCGTL